jgi:hypothetical protein
MLLNEPLIQTVRVVAAYFTGFPALETTTYPQLHLGRRGHHARHFLLMRRVTGFVDVLHAREVRRPGAGTRMLSKRIL